MFLPAPRLLRPADYRVMPWKNGLGTTTELVVEPSGAGLDAFTYRLSMADLLATGPFSLFPGVDRVLVQLEGEPMTLVHEGGDAHELELLVPYRFAGELATEGRLPRPPARDFNVMVRRDRASADLAVHRLAAGETVTATGDASTRLAFALQGGFTAHVGTAFVPVAERETLLVAGASPLALTASCERAIVLLTSIRLARAPSPRP